MGIEIISFRAVKTFSVERGDATVTCTLVPLSDTAFTGDERWMDPAGSNLARLLATDWVPIYHISPVHSVW